MVTDSAATGPKRDVIGDAVDMIHRYCCTDPNDTRCLLLRREVERAIRRIYWGAPR